MTRPAVLLLMAATAVFLLAAPMGRAADPAPDFDLVDIDGVPLNNTTLRGDVVVMEFSGTWCEPCRIVEGAFEEMYPEYGPQAVFMAVFLPPNNAQANLELHRDTHDTPWHLATDNDTMQQKFGVTSLPRVFILDRDGFVVLDWSPPLVFTRDDVKASVGPALDAALGGTLPPIDVIALSIPALMAIAALLSFFSPCSFPVLPAFMAYFLDLETRGGKATTGTAAGRGLIASLGMVTVYGIIAAIVAVAGIAAQGALAYLSPTVGVVLILAGVLTLLPYQYHWLTAPFSKLKKKLQARFGSGKEAGVGAKVFGMGFGYGAAGFACVAPVFVGAVLAASALGEPGEAALGMVVYVLIVIGLMIAITVTLHIAGDRAVRRLNKMSGIMKYVSAIALFVAGGYLLVLFLMATL